MRIAQPILCTTGPHFWERPETVEQIADVMKGFAAVGTSLPVARFGTFAGSLVMRGGFMLGSPTATFFISIALGGLVAAGAGAGLNLAGQAIQNAAFGTTGISSDQIAEAALWHGISGGVVTAVGYAIPFYRFPLQAGFKSFVRNFR